MRKYTVYILDWNKMGSAATAKLYDNDMHAVRDAILAGFYSLYHLEAESIHDVFRMLNVAHPTNYKLRSMSVGDIVIDEETNEAYVCRPVGWEQL